MEPGGHFWLGLVFLGFPAGLPILPALLPGLRVCRGAVNVAVTVSALRLAPYVAVFVSTETSLYDSVLCASLVLMTTIK